MHSLSWSPSSPSLWSPSPLIDITVWKWSNIIMRICWVQFFENRLLQLDYLSYNNYLVRSPNPLPPLVCTPLFAAPSWSPLYDVDLWYSINKSLAQKKHHCFRVAVESLVRCEHRIWVMRHSNNVTFSLRWYRRRFIAAAPARCNIQSH